MDQRKVYKIYVKKTFNRKNLEHSETYSMGTLLQIYTIFSIYILNQDWDHFQYKVYIAVFMTDSDFFQLSLNKLYINVAIILNHGVRLT